MKRLAVICLCVLILSAGAAHAASTFQGVSITPAIEQLNLNGQASLSYKIRLDNNQSAPVTLQVSSLDFKALNSTGGVAFISSKASQLEHKYGLANYIGLPTEPIVLPAKGGQFVNVTINNRADLSPGGHYAAILFKQVASSAKNSANTVNNDQVITSLVFIRKSGGAVYSLNLTKTDLHRRFAWFGWPSRIDGLFYNSGNVQTAPLGLVSLNGQHSQLNINSSLALPGSSRWVSADLSGVKQPFWPGFYHLSLSYHPDEGGKTKAYSIGFVYIGWPFLVAVLVVLAVLIWVLRRFKNRRYALRK